MRYFFSNAKKVFFTMLIILLAGSGNLWATTVTIRANKGRSTSNFYTSFTKQTDLGTVSWNAKLSQNSSGLFTLKPSDFLSFKADLEKGSFKGSAGLGEIRFDTGGLKSITNPSQNPSYTGLWLRSSRFDAALFSPILNAKSPQGVIAFLKSRNLTTGAGLYYRSRTASDSTTATWQTDYSSLDTQGYEGYFSINTGTQDSGIEITTKLNQFKGLSTTEDLGFNYKGFSYSLKMDGTVERSVSYTKTDGPYGLSVSFYEKKGMAPVYGGTSQKAQLRLVSDFGWNNIHIKTSSTKTYEEGTGSESFTKTGFWMEGRFEGIKYTTSVTAVLRRTSGTDLGFILPELTFKAQGVSFSFKDNKGVLEFKKRFQINKAGLVVCFNQNRLITVYTSFEL